MEHEARKIGDLKRSVLRRAVGFASTSSLGIRWDLEGMVDSTNCLTTVGKDWDAK